MEDCIFCKIVEGKEPADKVYEDDNIIVFPDINPHAPVHLLIVPKKHIKDIREVGVEIWDNIRQVAVKLEKERSLDGFRLVHNAGTAAMIPHMHVHFMAGISSERKL